MVPLSFQELLTWVFKEMEVKNSIFGMRRFYRHEGGVIPFLDSSIEIPCGPAAGPHTQLAQNLIAAYVSGARFFELKTVQTLDGLDLEVEKPCIWAGDEAYNVEWSTELYVQEAMQEYIKAFLLIQLLAKEFNLGDPNGFVFNMSVGYTLEGLQSEKINTFIDGLKDASTTEIYKECVQTLKENIHLFSVVKEEDIDALNPHVCSSIALSTMHGAKPEEIEPMLRHLIGKKGLHTFLKMNPTLLGYERARELLNQQGYKHLSFGREGFDHDLQFKDAKAMLARLLDFARENGKNFGVKLTNTFPVEIKDQTLPGEMMYMSGKPLFVLSLSVAILIAENFPEIMISYSGGADEFNIHELYETGISPITICTTLLKTGGYYRQDQISKSWKKDFVPEKLSVSKMKELLGRVQEDDFYHVSKEYKKQKTDLALPLHQCFMEPCQKGCPIDQDVSQYMELYEKGDVDSAMQVVLERNPLPFITGSICYAFCQSKCTRNHMDSNVSIRDIKLKIAQESNIRKVKTQDSNGKTALVIGAGATGMALSHLLARKGFSVKLIEKQEKLGGILSRVIKREPNLQEYIDQDANILKNMGVEIETSIEIENLQEYTKGYDHTFCCIGATNFSKLVGITKEEHEFMIDAAKTLGIRLVGEANSQKKSSVVECIADAWSVVEDLEKISAIEKINKDKIFNRKGLLFPVQQNDSTRCLHCETVCENCIDVCPNRANVSLEIEGLPKAEILHVDDLCNECGNCTMFCPYDGDPYREKLTVFSTQQTFDESKNPGFYIQENEIFLRENGEVKKTTVNQLEGTLQLVIDHILRNERYLLLAKK